MVPFLIIETIRYDAYYSRSYYSPILLFLILRISSRFSLALCIFLSLFSKAILRRYARLSVGDKPSIDASAEDIWCDNWRSIGVTPPNAGYQIQEIAKKIENLEDEFENFRNRWALTVTTYKDCFEPSKVIDATEILSK